MSESVRHYTAVAKALHWLVAVLVLGLLGVGLYMTRARLALPDKFQLYQLHKSVGLTVLALMVVRVLWRLTHRPPRLAAGMPMLERVAAHVAHALLYVLLLALPLTGWLMVSASSLPVPTRWFGLFQVPHLAPVAGIAAEARKPWEALFKEMHLVLVVSLMSLVVLHVAAALRHHLLLKDDTLRRMLPRRDRAAALLLACAIGWALTAAGLSRPALSQEAPRWTVDKARSSISFEASAGGQKVGGKFTDYAIDLRFDPAAPERTRIEVTIRPAGVRTGTAEIDDALTSADWLDAKAHPEASYAAERAEKAADGSYRLLGELTIKGRRVPVTLPFTLLVEGSRARVRGETTVDRLAFGVGKEGPVMDTVIGKEVRVVVALEAERAG